MDALTQRILNRFAARSIRVSPMEMKPCSHCGGEGTHTEKTLKVKSLCGRCFGTGTDPKSFEALQKESTEMSAEYQAKYDKFQQDKKNWGPGRSRPQFGQQGKNLQTLRAKVTARENQLKHEQERLDLGKHLARLAGAAAR